MSIPANAVTTIFDYHDQTKHHFQQYARSPGYLDWANQPHAFREYHDTSRIELALDIDPPPIAYRNLFEPGVISPYPVDRCSVSLLLRYSLALTAWKQSGKSRWALPRCAGPVATITTQVPDQPGLPVHRSSFPAPIPGLHEAKSGLYFRDQRGNGLTPHWHFGLVSSAAAGSRETVSDCEEHLGDRLGGPAE
jgi:hypothetical protein